MDNELDKQKLRSYLFPALNVLRGIELNLQDHECVYQLRISEATLNLCKLMEALK